MKTIFASFFMLLALNSFAGSSSIKIVLEQPEVEKLESDLNEKGFKLNKIQDVFATKGVYPRCPCNSLELTFTKVSGEKADEKVYSVYTQGFGTNLKVSVKPIKK